MSDHSEAAPNSRAETARPVEDPFAIEVLDPESCWAMLRANSVGRIAACMDGHPQIFPVTYVVDGESIVFRTASGTKLSATRDAEVAFEVDSYDSPHGVASSVIIAGRAGEIVDADEWDHAALTAAVPVARRADGPLRAHHACDHVGQALSGPLRGMTFAHPHRWASRKPPAVSRHNRDIHRVRRLPTDRRQLSRMRDGMVSEAANRATWLPILAAWVKAYSLALGV